MDHDLLVEMAKRVDANPHLADPQQMYTQEQYLQLVAAADPIVPEEAEDEELHKVEHESYAEALKSIEGSRSWLSGSALDIAVENVQAQEWYDATKYPIMPSALCFGGKITGKNVSVREIKEYANRILLKRQERGDSDFGVIFDANFGNAHWAVVEVLPGNGTIHVYDSSGNYVQHREENWLSKFREYCCVCWPNSGGQWAVEYRPCPQQVDGCACGIYTMCTKLMRLKGLDPMDPAGPLPTGMTDSESNAKIRQLRKDICKDLTNSADIPASFRWMGNMWLATRLD